MINNFATGIEIHLASQEVFTLFGLPITNAMITGAIGLVVLLAIFWYVVSMIRRGRYNRFIGLVQWAFEGMLGQVESVIPDKKLARQVAPLALTIFFFTLVSYWMSVLPGLDSVKVHDVPILRSIAADLNFTFAMAIIVLVVVQYFAWKTHGPVGSAKRYLRNPLKDPIGSFEGILELIGEISRYTALSLRLFGNCFAGEILLLIIAVLTSYLAVALLPVFMAFELFIGFIQAYVFFILTVIFTGLAVEVHGDAHDHSSEMHKEKGDVPM